MVRLSGLRVDMGMVIWPWLNSRLAGNAGVCPVEGLAIAVSQLSIGAADLHWHKPGSVFQQGQKLISRSAYC